MKKIFLTVLIGSVALAACKKDKEDDGKSKTELLQQNKWRISELNFSNAGGTQDLLALTADCDKDNLYMFNADKTITADEGGTKCNGTDPQTRTDGKWALENNDTKLSFRESAIFGAAGNITLDVLSITESTIAFTKDSSVTIPGVGTLSGKFNGKFINVK